MKAIYRPAPTYISYFLVSLQRLDNAGVLVAKAEFLDAMGEVVISLLHEAGHVGVGAHDGQHLARRHVEVARHLVEGQDPVHPTRVMGHSRLHSPGGHVWREENENGFLGKCTSLSLLPAYSLP